MQAMWALACVCKSTIKQRSSTASGIVQLARKNAADDDTRRLFDQFAQLVRTAGGGLVMRMGAKYTGTLALSSARG